MKSTTIIIIAVFFLSFFALCGGYSADVRITSDGKRILSNDVVVEMDGSGSRAYEIFSSDLNFAYEIDNKYGDYMISGIMDPMVSLELEGASLVNVLKVLSQQTGLNFISTEAVRERKLTLYFQDVCLREAMDIVFKANGLAYDYFPEAKIFIVKEMGQPTINLKAKAYRLEYFRLGSSPLQQRINDVFECDDDDSEGDSEGARGIVAAVRQALSANGKIVEDPQTNSLMVLDVPVQFALIDKVVKSLDVRQPRVMIEVEMLDVSKRLVDQLGFDYGSNGLMATFTGGSHPLAIPFSSTRSFTRAGGYSAMAATPGSFSLANLSSTMRMLSTDVSTRFLARPKILTLANETAVVNLTTNEAIGIKTTTTESTTVQEVERTDTGTKLKVTPQVGLSGEITLFVEMFTRQATNSGLTISGMTGFVRNPEERGTKSLVRLRDGETLLIGGLIRQDEDDAGNEIPFLSNIPLLGSLFRYDSSDREERELLVFITPRIIAENEEEGISFSKMSPNVTREQSLFARDDSVRVTLDSFSKQ